MTQLPRAKLATSARDRLTVGGWRVQWSHTRDVFNRGESTWELVWFQSLCFGAPSWERDVTHDHPYRGESKHAITANQRIGLVSPERSITPCQFQPASRANHCWNSMKRRSIREPAGKILRCEAVYIRLFCKALSVKEKVNCSSSTTGSNAIEPK